jgi:hypothetical protein
MKYLKSFLIGLTLLTGTVVYGAPTVQNFVNIQPFIDNTYDNGSATNAWRDVFTYGLKFSTTTGGCLQSSATGRVFNTGVSCGTGSGSSSFAFPFTVNANYNSTTTVIGFLVGLFSNSTTTINNNLFLPTLSQGILYTGSAGLVNSLATSTLTGSGVISVTAGAYTLGGTPIVVTCPTCNTSTSFAYPFTVGTFVSTTTPIQFTAGLGSYSSTTINGLKLSDLSAGFAGIGGLGQVYSFATSTIKTSQITNDSGFITSATSAYDIATTSNIAVPQLAYFTKTGGITTLGSVATGTISAGSTAITVTAGRSAVGGALAIDCATSSGSQNGCLSSTDWTTFNGKGAGTVTSVTVGAGHQNQGLVITSSGTIVGAIATSATPVINPAGVAYWTSVGDASNPAKLGTVATSTPTVTSPITYSGTLGSFIGGVAGTFACATCNTSAASVTSVAQTVPAGFVVSGSPITTSGTLAILANLSPKSIVTVDAAGTGLVATTSQLTVGSLIATTTNTSYFNGKLGIATTTPWALFSVNPNALGSGVPEFVVGSSSATHFMIDGAGNVGIGTTTPSNRLDVEGNVSADYLVKIHNTNNTGGSGLFIKVSDSSLQAYGLRVENATRATFVVENAGNIGIGTTSPWGTLGINAAAQTNPYFVIGSSSSQVFSISPSLQSSGTLTLSTTTAGCAALSSTGLFYSTGVACGTGGGSSQWATSTSPIDAIYNSAGNGGGYVGIGTTTPRWTLTVASTTRPQIALQGTNTNDVWTMRSIGNNFYLATASPTTFATSTKTAFTINTNGYVGIGSSSPSYPLSVIGNEWHNGDYFHYGDTVSNNSFQSACSQVTNCFEFVGNDNTTDGVSFALQNINRGASAYTGYTLLNDLSGNATTNYAGLYLNSSVYNDTTFGTGNNVPNLLQLGNSMGAISLQSYASTSAYSYINFLAGSTTPGAGPSTSQEIMRIVGGVGAVGIGTTTPRFLLNLATTTRAQIALQGTNTDNIWSLRSIGSNLYFSTSSPTTFATTSTSALTLLGTGLPSITIGTTTPQRTVRNGDIIMGGGGDAQGTTGSSTISMAKGQIEMMNTAGTLVCLYVVGTTATVTAGTCK